MSQQPRRRRRPARRGRPVSEMALARAIGLGSAVAVCAGAAAYSAVETRALHTRGVVADAVVVDEEFRGRRGDMMRVRFTAAGRQITGWRDDIEHRDVGDRLQVLYDPEHPTNFVEVEWGADYFATALWGSGAGAAGVALARDALVARRGRRT